jgi:hypothetical protein
MEQLSNYLGGLIGDVFKLLPMKEDERNGVENYLSKYLNGLKITITGAISTYPCLANDKEYLYIINNLNYIADNNVEFTCWRTVILDSTHRLSDLRDKYAHSVPNNEHQ